MAASKAKNKDAEAASSGVTRVIVEGEPVGGSPPEQPNLGAQEDESSPQPDHDAIAKLANEKLAAAAGASGFSDKQARDLLAATDAEPLWTPDSEKLNPYANKIARMTHENRKNKNDKAGVGFVEASK